MNKFVARKKRKTDSDSTSVMMLVYVTVLFTALLLPTQATEANSPYLDIQQASVNETNCVNSDTVVSAVSAFENPYSQEDGNGVEIIKSVELDSSSVDFLMNIPSNDVSWVETAPASFEHNYKNEKHVMNYSLTDIAEFTHEDKEPFTASASEDAPAAIVSDETVNKDFPHDFDFQSRILIGNLLLRENNKTIYTSPRKSESQNLKIKENDNFTAAEIISNSQENDHESSLKLTTRKRKKSRPFNHWDFGRRTKPPKNLTKEQLLFPKTFRPDIIVPFKNEEESNQYSPSQQLQNIPMYMRNTPTSNSEDYLPYIQQNSLQLQQVSTTDSEPHSVRDTQVYPETNEQQIPFRHSHPVVTDQEEENYYSRSTGHTPQIFFVARYIPGYKIIPQPVVLNTQGHHTTPPVYLSTQPGSQHYPLVIAQSSQTPVSVQTTE